MNTLLISLVEMRLILCLLLAFSASAQDVKSFFEVGLSANSYKGDLNSAYEKWTSSFHVGYKTNERKRINFHINASIGSVEGQNPDYRFVLSDGGVATPNKFFKSSIITGNVDLHFNLFKTKNWVLYLSQGIGFIRFNPKNESNESLINNFSNRANNETYSTTSLMLPTNVGGIYILPNGYGFGLQTGFLNPQTDYIDNISEWGTRDKKDNVLMWKFSFYAPLNFKENKGKIKRVTPPQVVQVSDDDHDGVNNEIDKCPNDVGPSSNNGCPILIIADTDGDGMIDTLDQCPTVAGLVENNGCPQVAEFKDIDGDSVPDMDDVYPEIPGIAENKGCPEVKKEDVVIIDKVKQTLVFETGKATILEISYPALDDFANQLMNDSTATVHIEGHTDNTGEEGANIKLSKERAKAVKNYLVNKGVSENRIESNGFGSSRPIESNESEEGRAKNRRVEIIMIYHDLK